MKYSHNQIKNIVLEIEKMFPVDEWTVHGIHIWPNIRFQLYFDLLSAKSNSLESPHPKTFKKPSFIWLIYVKLSALINYLYFKATLTQKDILFMGLSMHRVQFKGARYQRFFDPILEDFPDIKALHFELDELKNPYNKSSVSLSLLLKAYYWKNKFLKTIIENSQNEVELHLPDFENFETYLKSQEWYQKGFTIDKTYWINWARKVRFKSQFFNSVLRKAKPRQLIMSSYYGFENTAAAIYAAKQLGVTSIDFQHGPQSNTHLAYSYWSKVPAAGFNTMPDNYWCWDEISANDINLWNDKKVAQPAGNTWLQQTLGNKNYSPNTICYSLQVLNNENVTYFFNENLIKEIKSSPYHWVLRLHPRTVWGELELRNFLNSNNIENSNFDIETAQQSPLVDTLLNARVHITNFSGVLIEASQLGIPNVIIDEAGKTIFNAYLNNPNTVFISKTDPEFSSRLDNFVNDMNVDANLRLGKVRNPLEIFT